MIIHILDVHCFFCAKWISGKKASANSAATFACTLTTNTEHAPHAGGVRTVKREALIEELRSIENELSHVTQFRLFDERSARFLKLRLALTEQMFPLCDFKFMLRMVGPIQQDGEHAHRVRILAPILAAKP